MIACPSNKLVEVRPSSQSHHHSSHHKTMMCDICTYKIRKLDENERVLKKVDSGGASAEIIDTVQGTLSLVVVG